MAGRGLAMPWRGLAGRGRERFHEMSPPAVGSCVAPMDAVMAAHRPSVEPVDEWRRVRRHGDANAHHNTTSSTSSARPGPSADEGAARARVQDRRGRGRRERRLRSRIRTEGRGFGPAATRRQGPHSLRLSDCRLTNIRPGTAPAYCDDHQEPTDAGRAGRPTLDMCQRSAERASFWAGRRPQHVGGV